MLLERSCRGSRPCCAIQSHPVLFTDDTMMNLEVFFVSHALTGILVDIVMWHALLDHVRLDGTSFHVVEYNAMTIDDQASYGRVGDWGIAIRH